MAAEGRPRQIHVLHATYLNETSPDVHVATYRLNYADGQKVDLPVVYGQDVRDWNTGSDQGQATPKATTAWTGAGGNGAIRLFQRIYENPRPDAEVATIDLISANANAAPFVVAITVE